MTSIVLETPGAYVNIGNASEWRRRLCDHTTGLWFRTTHQAPCCLVSLGNAGHEAFCIDINIAPARDNGRVCAGGIAARAQDEAGRVLAAYTEVPPLADDRWHYVEVTITGGDTIHFKVDGDTITALYRSRETLANIAAPVATRPLYPADDLLGARNVDRHLRSHFTGRMGDVRVTGGDGRVVHWWIPDQAHGRTVWDRSAVVAKTQAVGHGAPAALHLHCVDCRWDTANLPPVSLYLDAAEGIIARAPFLTPRRVAHWLQPDSPHRGAPYAAHHSDDGGDNGEDDPDGDEGPSLQLPTEAFSGLPHVTPPSQGDLRPHGSPASDAAVSPERAAALPALRSALKPPESRTAPTPSAVRWVSDLEAGLPAPETPSASLRSGPGSPKAGHAFGAPFGLSVWLRCLRRSAAVVASVPLAPLPRSPGTPGDITGGIHFAINVGDEPCIALFVRGECLTSALDVCDGVWHEVSWRLDPFDGASVTVDGVAVPWEARDTDPTEPAPASSGGPPRSGSLDLDDDFALSPTAALGPPATLGEWLLSAFRAADKVALASVDDGPITAAAVDAFSRTDPARRHLVFGGRDFKGTLRETAVQLGSVTVRWAMGDGCGASAPPTTAFAGLSRVRALLGCRGAQGADPYPLTEARVQEMLHDGCGSAADIVKDHCGLQLDGRAPVWPKTLVPRSTPVFADGVTAELPSVPVDPDRGFEVDMFVRLHTDSGARHVSVASSLPPAGDAPVTPDSRSTPLGYGVLLTVAGVLRIEALASRIVVTVVQEPALGARRGTNGSLFAGSPDSGSLRRLSSPASEGSDDRSDKGSDRGPRPEVARFSAFSPQLEDGEWHRLRCVLGRFGAPAEEGGAAVGVEGQHGRRQVTVILDEAELDLVTEARRAWRERRQSSINNESGASASFSMADSGRPSRQGSLAGVSMLSSRSSSVAFPGTPVHGSAAESPADATLRKQYLHLVARIRAAQAALLVPTRQVYVTSAVVGGTRRFRGSFARVTFSCGELVPLHFALEDGSGVHLQRMPLYVRSLLPEAAVSPAISPRDSTVGAPTDATPVKDRGQANASNAYQQRFSDIVAPLDANPAPALLRVPHGIPPTWRSTRLPPMAQNMDGRRTFISAIDVGQCFRPADLGSFRVRLWVMDHSLPENPMGCLFSLHDRVYPSLNASAGIFLHTRLNVRSSPKKRIHAPFVTSFVLCDSAERYLTLETDFDFFDGTWHLIEWTVVDGRANQATITVDNRAVDTVLVCEDSPSDFSGVTDWALNVGARDEGDGGVMNHSRCDVRGLELFAEGKAEAAVAWPLDEGRGSVAFDKQGRVVGTIHAPRWVMTSFPPSTPHFSAKSGVEVAWVEDLHDAFRSDGGIAITLSLQTTSAAAGALVTVLNESRDAAFGITLNGGGGCGTELRPERGTHRVHVTWYGDGNGLGYAADTRREVALQLRCPELLDGVWHELQWRIPRDDPRECTVRVDNRPLPLLVISETAPRPEAKMRRADTVVPRSMLRRNASNVPRPDTAEGGAGMQRGAGSFLGSVDVLHSAGSASSIQPAMDPARQWGAVALGATQHQPSFEGLLKNVAVRSYLSPTPQLLLPLTGSMECISRAERDVASSNILWRLAVPPASCITMEPGRHVLLPPVRGLRLRAFEFRCHLRLPCCPEARDLALETALAKTKSGVFCSNAEDDVDGFCVAGAPGCLIDYGCEGAAFLRITLNENATGGHEPGTVHASIGDAEDRCLDVDAVLGAPLFDGDWHQFCFRVFDSKANRAMFYVDRQPQTVRYGECGSPFEFDDMHEGGSIGARLSGTEATAHAEGQVMRIQLCGMPDAHRRRPSGAGNSRAASFLNNTFNNTRSTVPLSPGCTPLTRLQRVPSLVSADGSVTTPANATMSTLAATYNGVGLLGESTGVQTNLVPPLSTGGWSRGPSGSLGVASPGTEALRQREEQREAGEDGVMSLVMPLPPLDTADGSSPNYTLTPEADRALSMANEDEALALTATAAFPGVAVHPEQTRVTYCRWDMRAGYGVVLRDTSGSRHHATAVRPLWQTFIHDPVVLSEADLSRRSLSDASGSGPTPAPGERLLHHVASTPGPMPTLRSSRRLLEPGPRSGATRSVRPVAVEIFEAGLPSEATNLVRGASITVSRWSNNEADEIEYCPATGDVVLAQWPADGWHAGQCGPQHLTIALPEPSTLFALRFVVPRSCNAVYDVYLSRSTPKELDAKGGDTLVKAQAAKVRQVRTTPSTCRVTVTHFETPYHQVRTVRLVVAESGIPVRLEAVQVYGTPYLFDPDLTHRPAPRGERDEERPRVIPTLSPGGFGLGDGPEPGASVRRSLPGNPRGSVYIKDPPQGPHDRRGRRPSEDAFWAEEGDDLTDWGRRVTLEAERGWAREVRQLFYTLDVHRTGRVRRDEFVALYQERDVIGAVSAETLERELVLNRCAKDGDMMDFDTFRTLITRLDRQL